MISLHSRLVAWHNARGWWNCSHKSLLRLWVEFRAKGGQRKDIAP